MVEFSEKTSQNDNSNSVKWGFLPLSIFKNTSLSAFEIIVKFLKDELKLTHKEISELVGRHPGAVALTYSNSKKKTSERLSIQKGKQIPISIFLNRKLSILENLALYLSKKFSVNQISELLVKNPQTIYTVLRRAKQKNEKQN